MSKAAFIVGTGLGYVLGTRAGRQRFETIKRWTRSAWENPRVQTRVSEIQAKGADFAKTEAAAIKGRVTENIKSAVSSRTGGSSGATGPVERHAVAPSYPATATTDGAPFVTPPGERP